MIAQLLLLMLLAAIGPAVSVAPSPQAPTPTQTPTPIATSWFSSNQGANAAPSAVCKCEDVFSYTEFLAYDLESSGGKSVPGKDKLLKASRLREKAGQQVQTCLSRKKLAGARADWLLHAANQYLLAAEDAHYAGDNSRLVARLLQQGLTIYSKVLAVGANESTDAKRGVQSATAYLRGEWGPAEFVYGHAPSLPEPKRCLTSWLST
jgi:hypothetical protein